MLNKVFLVSFFCLFFFTACEKGEITTYVVPKEKPKEEMAPPFASTTPPAPGPAISNIDPNQEYSLKWSAPKNWIKKPSTQFRKGSYDIPLTDANTIDLSIISFPGQAGGLLNNINRWRGQAGLPPATTLEASGMTPMKIAGVDGYWVELIDGNPQSGILGAVIPLTQETWFIKSLGDVTDLQSVKQDILQFVDTLQGQ